MTKIFPVSVFAFLFVFVVIFLARMEWNQLIGTAQTAQCACAPGESPRKWQVNTCNRSTGSRHFKTKIENEIYLCLGLCVITD
jgi:hypothetical protein